MDFVFTKVDPRTGNVEEEALAHEGSKGARAIYLKNGLVMIIPSVLPDKSIIYLKNGLVMIIQCVLISLLSTSRIAW